MAVTSTLCKCCQMQWHHMPEITDPSTSFLGVVGYRVRLIIGRPPVRSWQEATLFFFLISPLPGDLPWKLGCSCYSKLLTLCLCLSYCLFLLHYYYNSMVYSSSRQQTATGQHLSSCSYKHDSAYTKLLQASKRLSQCWRLQSCTYYNSSSSMCV
jgi:hypothetical protein